MLPTSATPHVLWRGRASCQMPRRHWHRWRGPERGTRSLALVRDFPPNTITPEITSITLHQRFFPHAPVTFAMMHALMHTRASRQAGKEAPHDHPPRSDQKSLRSLPVPSTRLLLWWQGCSSMVSFQSPLRKGHSRFWTV